MPVLKNPRHERFAQELAKGKGSTEAYVAAGYGESPAAATRLSKKVKKRVEELLSGAAKRAEITIEKIANELALLGFANIEDYLTINDDGDPRVNLAKMTRAQAAAVQEVTIQTREEKGGEGRADAEVKSVRFKLSDKRAALVDLGKHLGMFKERIEHTGKDGGPIETVDLSPTEAARRIAFTLARARQEKHSTH